MACFLTQNRPDFELQKKKPAVLGNQNKHLRPFICASLTIAYDYDVSGRFL